MNNPSQTPIPPFNESGPQWPPARAAMNAVRGVSPASVLATLGGLAAILQVLLPWEQVGSVPTPLFGFSGAEANGGKLILGLGLVILSLSLIVRWKAMSRPVAAVVIALGLLIVLVGVGNYLSIQDNIKQWNVFVGSVPGATQALGFSVGTGVYVAIAGGAIATLAGVLGLIGARRAI